MTQELSLYNKARTALAECKTTDEVKDIRDKAMAMRIYAQQANDRTLEEDAIGIRMRAERRLGEMMREQPKNRGEATQFGFAAGLSENPPMTLASAGIDKNLAHRARVLARMSDDEFESFVNDKQSSLSIDLVRLEYSVPPADPGLDLDDLTCVIKNISREVHRYPPDKLRRMCEACSEFVLYVETTDLGDNITWLSGKK